MADTEEVTNVWGYGVSALAADNYTLEKGSEMAKKWEKPGKPKPPKSKPEPRLSGVDCLSAFFRLREETKPMGTDEFSHWLLNTPAAWVLLGRSMASRKSTALANLLINPELYGDAFQGENIFLISPTASMDPKYQLICEYKQVPKENMITELSVEVFEYLFDYIYEDKQRRHNEGLEPVQYFIGIDDAGYSKLVHESAAVNKLFSNGRHANITVAACIQTITMLSPVARKNARLLIYFDVVDFEKMETSRQFGYWDPKTMLRMLHTCTRIKGQCLVQTVPTRGENKLYWGACSTFYDVTPKGRSYNTEGQFDKLEEAEAKIMENIEVLRKEGVWTSEDDILAGLPQVVQTTHTEHSLTLDAKAIQNADKKNKKRRQTAKRRKRDEEETERRVRAKLLEKEQAQNHEHEQADS